MELLIRNSRCISLIFLLIHLVQTAWTLCSECTDENKSAILTTCQSSASSLEKAENLNNVTLVCSRLHELFLCVGEKVPQCLEMFSEQYQEYFYTPWDCHVSNEQVVTYQNFVHNGCTSKSDTLTSSSAFKIHAGIPQFLMVLSGWLILNNS